MNELEARQLFATFLKENPQATIAEHEFQDAKGLVIKNAWGDESFVLSIPDDDPRVLADALENL